MKVILALSDLELTPDSTMAFVHDSFLVNISRNDRLTDNSFYDGELLAKGVLLHRRGHWKRHGYVKVDDDTVSENEIDFPTWNGVDPNDREAATTVWCRGELEIQHTDMDYLEIERRWSSMLLTRRCPEQLSTIVSNYELAGWFREGDPRYHPKRKAICKEFDLDLDTFYLSLLPVERRKIYKKAIAS